MPHVALGHLHVESQYGESGGTILKWAHGCSSERLSNAEEKKPFSSQENSVQHYQQDAITQGNHKGRAFIFQSTKSPIDFEIDVVFKIFKFV